MQQYSVRVRKTAPSVKYELMKFNAPLKNEFIPNLPGKIYREKDYIMLKKGLTKNNDESEESQYGAGSSYSQYVKNEKKQLGTPNVSKDSDLSPWIMNLGNGKSLRSYKGNREGNVSENASYYVFMQTADGAFDAYPISAWYTFTPIPKHKTLNDDEAEEEFNRRDKVLNYFSIMVQKRLKTETEPEAENSEGGSDKKSQSLQIRDEMEESELGSGNEFEDENEKNNNTEKKKAFQGNKKGRPGKKGGKKNKGKNEEDLEEEAAEESDDGDEEGQEMDYMSSGPSSDSEAEDKKKIIQNENQKNGQVIDTGIEMDELIDEDELLGVQDEPALREEEYDEEADDENVSSRDGPNDNFEGADKMGDDGGGGGDKGEGKKSKSKHKHQRIEGNNNSIKDAGSDKTVDVRMRSEFSGKSSNSSSTSSTSSSSSSGDDDDGDSSSDSDVEIDDNAIQSSIFLQNKVAQPSTSFQSRSDASMQGQNKRKLGEPVENSQSKKLLVEPIRMPDVSPVGNVVGMVLNEENVRRYLTRRPMTTKDLLHKFKNKVDTKAQLADRMATILKQINPEKKFIKAKMYLSL